MLAPCKFVANTHFLKLHWLQNMVLHTICQFPMWSLVHKLHMAFQVPYIYDYITKLCRQQAKVIQNHENGLIRNIRKDEAWHRKYKRLKLGSSKVYDPSSD
jgi:hypothetical protein